MRSLNLSEVSDWLVTQKWLTLRDPAGLRFDLIDTNGLTQYVATIAADSACVGVDMAEVFLHGVVPAEFPGGLFWIARPVYASISHWILVEQILRAGGLTTSERIPSFLLLEPNDYGTCFALVALTLMFGWDANLVLAGRRFLLAIDDEPFPTLITDRDSDWFSEVAKNLDFKVSHLSAPAT